MPPRSNENDDVVPLAPREPLVSPRFHRGAHAPFAIRWFGISALVGHVRHLIAVSAASRQLDLRDWMRPDDPAALVARVARVLGAPRSAGSLTESLGREVWIDFVADTGDDRDVSLAVGRMLFAKYALTGDGSRVLPRGDLLLLGGDTAYPAATASEIQRRLLRPWNLVLRGRDEPGRRRVLLGIPGNHDWYDGLDGFGRLFRKEALDELADAAPAKEAPSSASDDPMSGRVEGTLQRQLHLDELGESLRLAEETLESVAAFFLRSKVRRQKRLSLSGYRAVQEASFWALALAPSLDLWGVDRQLRNMDFRQRIFFSARRASARPRKVMFTAPDPAVVYGEPNEPGAKLLDACSLSLRRDRLLYLTGDAHHYERYDVADSMHVVAGGGGAFLHGSRVAPYRTRAPVCVYPDRETSLRLALSMPLKLVAGAAGLFPHVTFAALAALQLSASARGPAFGWSVLVLITLIGGFGLSVAVRARLERPVATWSLSILFALLMGLGPWLLRVLIPAAWSTLGHVMLVVIGNAFLGSLLLGLFLLTLILTALEHQQGFAALGHPGFRHFVRLCVHPDGRVEGFVIGKDDPLGKGLPVLIDRFEW